MSPSHVPGRVARGGKLWSGQNPHVVPPEGWGQGVVQGPRPAAGDAEGGPAPGSGGVRAHSPGPCRLRCSQDLVSTFSFILIPLESSQVIRSRLPFREEKNEVQVLPSPPCNTEL